MTETEKKALALVNEVCAEMGLEKVSSLELDMPGERALLRAIEQHEAFKLEVSDALENYYGINSCKPHRLLAPFIIPKPDPLVEALQMMGWAYDGIGPEHATALRTALAARGLEVRKIGKGE